MQLKVFKYEGAGNDFVALDNRTGDVPDGEDRANLVRALCNRRRGLGADGVLVVEPPRAASDFAMRYHNADGSEGEMCGNGARCIAAFAVSLSAAGETMTFDTEAGAYRAQILKSGDVEVAFPDVNSRPEFRPVEDWDIDFLVVGVPHAVVWVDDVEEVNVIASGRMLRNHGAFAPAGTNVNFAMADSDRHIRVRTYERGVEEETLACGTGSVSAAISLAHRRGMTGPQRITVIPTSGDALTIGFELNGIGSTNVTLSGPARFVFSTVIEYRDGRISAAFPV